MPDRRPIVVGNWKMNTTRAEGIDLARDIAEALAADASLAAVDVGICPPFTTIDAVASAVQNESAPILVGGQDVYVHSSGAFTGEIAPEMLLDVGAHLVLIGHSERRHILGETDDLINRKVLAAAAAGLHVILCIGETESQRDAGETDAVNAHQLREGLAGFDPDRLHQLTIAYEPVWAIGTGKTASASDAQAAHASARGVLSDLFGSEAAGGVRIQYGGSMKAGNAAELLAEADVDGGLIGGASLKASEFLAIAHAAAGVA